MKFLTEFPYLYETHLHTSQGSACGKVPGSGMAQVAKERGYTGIIVTDHHWGGNTRPDKSQPWEQWVDEFCSGYEDAKKTGDKIDLDVFMGWESGFNATEFLVYGLDKTWMKAHPELKTCSVEEQYKLVHEAGGMVIHAHPFREAHYIPEIRLFPEWVDGIEAINAQHSNPKVTGHYNPDYNHRAVSYGREHNFPMTAGSDIHRTDLLMGGVAFSHRLTSIQDYIETIKSREGYVLTDGVVWYDTRGNVIAPVETEE
ncbi:MAG: histidinol-phosphatase [Lachnospiraceae bacterium]|nr:histidinol-phosphatase [Lachnospiraceae bacterium]